MKTILTGIFLLLSVNLYAEGCNSPDWVFPPRMEGKLLVLKIKGICSLDRIGTFNSLMDHFVKKVTKDPKVLKVHNINENATLGNLPAHQIDSTIDLKSNEGKMTVRFMTTIGTDGQDQLVFEQDSKDFVESSGNAKYVKKLYFNYNVMTSGNGVTIEVVQETRIQSPGMFESIFIKEATKAVKNSFSAELPKTVKEISDNF